MPENKPDNTLSEMSPEQFKEFQAALSSGGLASTKLVEEVNKLGESKFIPDEGKVLIESDGVETKITKIPAAPTTLDWEAARIHLYQVEQSLLKYAGQPKHNPYIWMTNLGFFKMQEEYKNNIRTEELHAKIMSLPLDCVPSV